MAFLRIAVVLALFAAQGSHAARVAASADAQRRAEEWMRMHAGDDPDQAGLDELKATNPDAFAIVNALLTKRSLGLLNSRHPSASFQPGADEEQPKGPSAVDVLRAASQPQPGSAVEVPVAAVAVSAPVSHHSGSWLNWKPQQDDDAMVKNVLGAVADLKINDASAATSSLLSHSRAESVAADGPAVAQEEAVAPAVEAEPAPAEQHRLGALSFDWGKGQAQTPNPYLASISGGPSGSSGSSGTMPAKPAAPQGNLLASFSWDSAAGSDQPLQQQGADTVPAVMSSTLGGGALGHWLR